MIIQREAGARFGGSIFRCHIGCIKILDFPDDLLDLEERTILTKLEERLFLTRPCCEVISQNNFNSARRGQNERIGGL